MSYVKEELKSSYNQSVAQREKAQMEGWKQEELDRFVEAMRHRDKDRDKDKDMDMDKAMELDKAKGKDMGTAKILYKSKVLDMGAGTGGSSLYLQEKGIQVTCIDLSPSMVESCRKKGLHALEMDFYHLDFPDNSFDGIWAMNTLLHVPKADLPGVLAEVKRVLKPDGLFYMGVYGGWNSEGIWEKDHYSPKRFFSCFDEASLKKAISGYFSINEFIAIPLEDNELDFYGLLLAGEQES